MARVRRTARDPWKMKKWYTVHAPPEFNKVVIGETPAREASDLPGRVIQTSLSELSGDRRDFRKQKQKISFKITKVKDKKAESVFDSHKITKDYERSLGKRGGEKIYGWYVVKTNDGIQLKVSVISIAIKEPTRHQRNEISKSIKNILATEAQKKSLANMIQNLLFGKTGARMYKAVNKIYPTKLVLISKTEVLKR